MPADLVVLAMNDFYVTFGMDWLAKYRACLDCFRKIITFRVDEASASVLYEGTQKKFDTRLVSALKAERIMRSGCEGYIAFISEKKPVQKLKNIHIVCEFPDVFPDEVSGLPPFQTCFQMKCRVYLQQGKWTYNRTCARYCTDI